MQAWWCRSPASMAYVLSIFISYHNHDFTLHYNFFYINSYLIVADSVKPPILEIYLGHVFQTSMFPCFSRTNNIIVVCKRSSSPAPQMFVKWVRGHLQLYLGFFVHGLFGIDSEVHVENISMRLNRMQWGKLHLRMSKPGTLVRGIMGRL